MANTDLILRVRSAGIVPHKDRPGEQLTWKRLQVAAIVAAYAAAAVSTTNNNKDLNTGTTLNIQKKNNTKKKAQKNINVAEEEVTSFVYASNDSGGGRGMVLPPPLPLSSHITHQPLPSRPRSAASYSLSPSSVFSSASSSATSSSCEEISCDHHHQSEMSPSTNITITNNNNIHHTATPPITTIVPNTTTSAIYAEHIEMKQLYIRCHQPGSSLGCSVVNGPNTCPGIFVQDVKKGKLAARCGLEIGDQIIKVNNVDVATIGFDDAITLLKSLTNLSLLVRKGVARHIFQW